MALPIPKLDDRHFQDIVDEAKKRIPHYCREWTDHNVSDPGVTLIELFAWMTDILLYRLNQVPDLHYIKFMEMLGIKLQEPVAAQVPVTFWLSSPQPIPVTIPTGTEVASTQTAAERSIVFTTDANLLINPPKLATLLVLVGAGSGTKKVFRELDVRGLAIGLEKDKEGISIFSPIPGENDALYLGFENDLSFHLLGMKVDFEHAAGATIIPHLPPYRWEACTGEARWSECSVEEDSTRGLNDVGNVKLHLPKLTRSTIAGKELYWVRVRIIRDKTTPPSGDDIQPYDTSPKLRQLVAVSWGGTINATHSRLVQDEFLGRSDGSAGQRFNLKSAPVLKRLPEEYLTVHVDGRQPERWHEVPDFAETRADYPCYTLDGFSGEIRFGPAIRQPDGAIRLYGAVPARGANLFFTHYRHGGGEIGNVMANLLNTCKTSIPYVDKVANREPARGGLDAESLEAAMARVPGLLRSRNRAVTESDFEFLARQALPAEIGRVKCLQPRASNDSVTPGMVWVLVLPRLVQPEGYILPDELILKPEIQAALKAFLDERRLLTTHVEVRAPEIQWVSARVRLSPSPGADLSELEASILARLHRFLNPLTGGPEGSGWPFGRSLFAADVYQCLQGIPNVQFIRSLELFKATASGEPRGDPVDSIELLAHSTIASGRHWVEFN